MKTKLRILQGLVVVMLLLGGVMNGWAQDPTNQEVTQTVCVGNQPYLVTESTLPNPTYTWTISPGTDGVDWHINGNTNSITVDWLIPGDYTLSVFTTSNSCPGAPQQVEVTVVAQPVGPTLLAQVPAATTVCEGQLVNATFVAGSGGSGCTDEYQYSYDGLGVWVAYTPGDNIVTAGHTLVEIQGRRGGCTSIAGGCTGTNWLTLATWSVTSEPLFSVAITASVDPVCVGTEVTYTANVTNGGITTFAWHINGGPIVGTDATYTYTPAALDVVSCDVSNMGTCTNSGMTPTFRPTVNPIPTTSPIFHN